jgi:hypothetical protein
MFTIQLFKLKPIILDVINIRHTCCTSEGGTTTLSVTMASSKICMLSFSTIGACLAALSLHKSVVEYPCPEWAASTEASLDCVVPDNKSY